MSNARKSRGWCFTTFAGHVEPDNLEAYRESLKSFNCKYLVAGFELCPDTAREHIQGYVYFPNAKTLSAVRKLIKGNLTAANGNGTENRAYCIKGGAFIEIGTVPMSPAAKGAVEMYTYLI